MPPTPRGLSVDAVGAKLSVVGSPHLSSVKGLGTPEVDPQRKLETANSESSIESLFAAQILAMGFGGSSADPPIPPKDFPRKTAVLPPVPLSANRVTNSEEVSVVSEVGGGARPLANLGVRPVFEEGVQKLSSSAEIAATMVPPKDVRTLVHELQTKENEPKMACMDVYSGAVSNSLGLATPFATNERNSNLTIKQEDHKEDATAPAKLEDSLPLEVTNANLIDTKGSDTHEITDVKVENTEIGVEQPDEHQNFHTNDTPYVDAGDDNRDYDNTRNANIITGSGVVVEDDVDIIANVLGNAIAAAYSEDVVTGDVVNALLDTNGLDENVGVNIVKEEYDTKDEDRAMIDELLSSTMLPPGDDIQTLIHANADVEGRNIVFVSGNNCESDMDVDIDDDPIVGRDDIATPSSTLMEYPECSTADSVVDGLYKCDGEGIDLDGGDLTNLTEWVGDGVVGDDENIYNCVVSDCTEGYSSEFKTDIFGNVINNGSFYDGGGGGTNYYGTEGYFGVENRNGDDGEGDDEYNSDYFPSAENYNVSSDNSGNNSSGNNNDDLSHSNFRTSDETSK